MALSLTLTGIQKDADGAVRFRFGKREREFPSLAAALEFVRGTLDRDALEAVAVALCLARQPALGSPGVFAGKVLTVDLAQASWGTVA